jgi:hypothetical protein
MLVNVYAHQVKVNGTDHSSAPGIVLIDKPIEALSQVSRSTVGQSYEAIVSDFNLAIMHFDAAGGDRQSLVFFNKAAVYGLLARTHLYLEDWDKAMQYAQIALDEKGIAELTYGTAKYKALYNNEASNTESMFALAITQTGRLIRAVHCGLVTTIVRVLNCKPFMVKTIVVQVSSNGMLNLLQLCLYSKLVNFHIMILVTLLMEPIIL